MVRRPPRSTRTDTLFPYTTLFRSCRHRRSSAISGGDISMRIAPETPHTDCCAGSQGPPSPPPAVPKHDALKDERISYAIRYAHYEPRAQDYRRGHRRTRPIALRGARTRHHADELARSGLRSEEHTSELQSLMRISYAVFCLKKKKQ